jgi:hypothetical protein
MRFSVLTTLQSPELVSFYRLEKVRESFLVPWLLRLPLAPETHFGSFGC